MTTPSRLVHLLGRDLTPIQPKPADTPRRYSWEGAKLTGEDVDREAVILERLAELTDQHATPRDAALELFGGRP